MQLRLIVDNVRSKENVGALFRTADGAGVSEVVLCGISPCPLNRFGVRDGKVAKAALGAEEVVPWRYAEHAVDAVRDMQKEGLYVVALEQTPSAIDFAAFKGPKKEIALVVGNEVHGVTRDVLDAVDAVVHIPMYGAKESLNVTTAAGIALFSFRRYDS